MKEFEWFEWFEWFGPSPIEPFNSGYQGNIKADNGIIHMINEVIYPGWSESSGGYGGSGSQSFDEFAKSKLK